MSECQLISRSLIPLLAAGVAFRLSQCVRVCGHTLGINSDNLQASCYSNLWFC